jgi:putative nucleotidyltransferase with HDIG domain
MDTHATPAALASASPARMLVVDDDAEVCRLIEEVFASHGDLHVTCCTDPRDALEQLQHRPVDVVMTDLFMGKYSGMDVLEATRQFHPDAVVIMMTGQPSVENAVSAMRRGAYDYVLKPFDLHSLQRTVARAIERRRLWTENAHLTQLVNLYRLSCAATSPQDLQQIVHLALDAVTAEFAPDFVAMFLVQNEVPSEALASAGEPVGKDEEDFFRAQDVASEEALRTGQPVVTLLPYGRGIRPVPAGATLGASRISYPFRVGGRTVGLINLQCPPRPEPINAGDLKSLAILSGQVGAALENRRLVERLQSAYIDMVHALASALDARDRNTRDHTHRVCHLAEAIAREMGWEEERMPELWLGCVLHDIGKIGVPDTILQKPGPLTGDEYELMKAHTLQGARMIEAIPYLKPAVPYILYHHEKYDGSGYPHGLAGADIPEEARLLAVVDTFDAIISDRPYRRGRSVAVALAEIQACSGSQFDPEVVAAFLRAWSTGAVDRRRIAVPGPDGRAFVPEFKIRVA